MVGGLFVVTGPTVIMPLLRQAHLKSRPAAVLKWEGIVNDPLGALFAVGGYEFIRFTMLEGSIYIAFGNWYFVWLWPRGHIPEYLKAPVVLAEYLKAPVVLAWVLAIYVLANNLADETGLLAVTALGMTMANTKFAIILVSGVFVILTATLTPDVLKAFLTEWRVLAFVLAMMLAMMLLVRPIAVMFSTLFSGLHWKESLLISIIAPRLRQNCKH